MNLRRSAKILALDAVSSQSHSNPTLAAPLLRLLRMDYGPITETHPGGQKMSAVACVSVDFDVTLPSRFENNRKGTIALVELAEKYKIPITWAVCGESAEKDTKSYSAIADSSRDNEIGVHTYSHLDATTTTADHFRSDIEHCIHVLGLESPRTFVFPWNRERHLDVIRELGFRVFRGKHRAIGNPVMKEGIWNVRPVYYVDQKSLGAESLMKKYVDLCIDLSTPFHMWAHPWGLVIGGDTTPMMGTLESLFAYIGEKREKGMLTTTTLGGFATSLDKEAVRAKEQASELIQTPVGEK